MRFLLVAPPLILVSLVAHSQWLCREASSTRSGQIITACGVGLSQNLEDARVKSRESAIEEFRRVCQLSADCLEYDYTVVPKRTDCELKENHHICYRALDFEISDRKRKSISLDISELELSLIQHNQEIRLLQSRIEQINQVKLSEREAALKQQELAELENSLNKKEAEALKLQDLNSPGSIESGGYTYLHQAFKNSIKVSFAYWASQITSSTESDIMWLAAYEKRPFSWLGVQVYGGFVRGHVSNQKDSVTDVPTQGVGNTTQVFNGTPVYGDIGLAALVYPGWRGTYLKMELGKVIGHQDTYTVVFNGAGTGSPETKTNNISSNYWGTQLGFDSRDDREGWGAYFELGGRKLGDKSNPGFVGSFGVNYGF